ncbi:MAG: 23S rRNA (uracil(1939)-C(5))-methyltransferase RlmD [Desulfobacterales bacterium]|nr:23S rRNA (uracil(1939)-C(5))-methyltransferase RlmD [Desulfobacterales bacterium]
MAVKKGQVHDLTIDNIAFGGKGIARIEGLAVFVDQTVPGDRVRARVVKKKKNFAEARIEELLEPSPDRVVPPCPYSGFCGGCKWQFLAYDRQLVYKRRHVAEAIEHIGLIQGVDVLPTVASERVFGYRNKMEFSCSDRQWLLPEEMAAGVKASGFALGLHVPGTYNKVLDTQACLLQPDLGNHIMEEVRQYMKNAGLPPYGLKSHEGFWRFLMLRHSVSRDQWMVNIITASENLSVVMPLAEALVAAHPEVVSVVNNITARRAGVAVGETEVPLAGQPYLTDAIGHFQFKISANSFFQTNTRGAESLYGIVRAYAGLTGGETVLDLYCGTGTIAICLAAAAKEVIGIEMVASAVDDARENCRRNQVSNCRFIHGDIKDVLAGAAAVPDVMIIDPPRVGMHQRVVEQVLELAPERIVYVSCNPATLARDLALMADRYRVTEAQPVDLFPHTFHIETVARLERV